MLTYEEILITILGLSKDSTDQAVQSADVAHRMHVTRPAMHNRIIKLMERGLLVKDARKKLRFTPEGLAYTTGLAKEVIELQSLCTGAWGLSKPEAKNCAFAMVSTLSEDSRRRLIHSVELSSLTERGKEAGNGRMDEREDGGTKRRALLQEA